MAFDDAMAMLNARRILTTPLLVPAPRSPCIRCSNSGNRDFEDRCEAFMWAPISYVLVSCVITNNNNLTLALKITYASRTTKKYWLGHGVCSESYRCLAFNGWICSPKSH